MDTKYEGVRDLEFLLSEAPGKLSRDVRTIADGEGKLEAGTVLGRVTATDKFVASPNAETVGKEGAEVAVAVLAYNTDASNGDAEAVVVDTACEVKLPDLKFEGSVDNAAKKATKIEQLRAVDIKAR